MRILSALILLAACGDNATTSSATPDASAVDAKTIDATPIIERTKTIMLTGGANAVIYDAASQTAYLTDNNANTLLEYTDTGGLETVGTFPPASAGISLGDLVRRSDGTILTTNFGFGTQGTYFAMAPDKTSRSLTVTDAAKRRIGFAQDAAGAMYTSYFVGGGGGVQNGGVSTVTLAGDIVTEVEIAGTTTTAGFKKLVGLVATPTAVYVSDQTQKIIFKITIPGNVVSPLATVPSADLLAMMPNGDVLTGGTGVHRVTPAGAVTTILPGEFEQVRGLAYDSANKRLFIIDHSATPGTPDKLQIRPLDN